MWIEYGKTKTKAIIVTNHNRTMDQSEFEANTCNQQRARENACEEVTIGFGLASIGLKKKKNGGTLPTIQRRQ